MTLHEGVAHYREVAQLALSHPAVAAADVLPDDPRLDGPGVELTIEADRVPPGVMQTLGEHDAGVVRASPRAAGDVLSVVVR